MPFRPRTSMLRVRQLDLHVRFTTALSVKEHCKAGPRLRDACAHDRFAAGVELANPAKLRPSFSHRHEWRDDGGPKTRLLSLDNHLPRGNLSLVTSRYFPIGKAVFFDLAGHASAGLMPRGSHARHHTYDVAMRAGVGTNISCHKNKEQQFKNTKARRVPMNSIVAR